MPESHLRTVRAAYVTVAEHLPPEQLPTTLAEFHRVLRDAGL